MTRLLIALPLLLAVGQAAAIERYDASRMTCEQVQTTLQSEGKVVFKTPSSKVAGMMKYERYVRDRMSCGAGGQNWALPAKVRTSDNNACPVYRCISVSKGTVRY